MGITAGYHFYLLPEQTYDFMHLLMQEVSVDTSLHWVWPDGRKILRIGQYETEQPKPMPFEDAWKVNRRIAVFLPENKDVRSYAHIPEPKWWEKLLRQNRQLKYREVWFHLEIVTSPTQLQWETGQPTYIRVEFNANYSSSLALLFHNPTFREFVTRLAHAGNAVALVIDSDGEYLPMLLDGQPVQHPFTDVHSPERQREFVQAFAHKTSVIANPPSDPLDQASCLVDLLNFRDWGKSLTPDELQPWLKDESPLVRRLAVWALRLGPVCWADIQPYLNDPCPGVRQLACEVLQEVENEEVWEDVVYGLLRDPDPGVRIMAGNGLRYTSHWSEVEIFLLRDTHPQVRLAGEYIRAERIMLDEVAKRNQ